VRNDLDARVRKIFGRLFPVDPAALTDSDRRGELQGWDSLGHLDLVTALENEFQVSIEADRALEIETFGEAKQVLAQLLGDA
jgi:acyl carrier protein